MEGIRKAMDLSRGARPARLADESLVGAGAEGQAPRAQSFVAPPELLERNRIVLGSSTTQAADAFRLLRTQVLQRMGENSWRSIAVVSPGASDGRSLAAVNLAAAIAADSRYSALLVDLDLRAPSIARLFGLDPTYGVDDVLRGTARIDQCLYRPDSLERLVLLPGRAPLAGSSEWLASGAARALVAELGGRYAERVLVFDLPPLLTADDALAFSPLVDCALMVVSEGTTRRADVVRAMELLRQTPVVGSVLNRVAGLPRSRV